VEYTFNSLSARAIYRERNPEQRRGCGIGNIIGRQHYDDYKWLHNIIISVL
jgi:hypothetical protein